MTDNNLLLTDEEMKDWVVDRTGSTYLYDHARGVFKDLIDKTEPLIRADEREKVLKEILDKIDDWFAFNMPLLHEQLESSARWKQFLESLKSGKL